MNIGRYALANRVFVAPMAGVTDRPFRQLCKRLGAGYAVSEMAASNPLLWTTVKSSRRINHDGEAEPRSVQIAGADPQMLAEAARFNVDRGAQIIDINMGCPAKKVCHVMAGSALMANETLALRIIEATANAVSVPVTVKMRTGPSPTERNALRLAIGAEAAGAAMITIHGRTRACGFTGQAEYDTIAAVKAAVRVPVVANGDIDSPRKAAWVLARTGADAVMIGRAAQGRPWIFGQIDHYLRTGEEAAPPTLAAFARLMREHLLDHYAFYGEASGIRTVRKHVGWYLGNGLLAQAQAVQAQAVQAQAVQEPRGHVSPERFLADFYRIEDAAQQLRALDAYFNEQPSVDSARPASDAPQAANDAQFNRSWLA